MSHRIQQRSQCKHTLETYTTIYYPFVYHVPASRYNAEHTTVKTKLYYIISAVFLLLSFFSFPSQPPSLVSLSVRVSDRPCDVNFFLCLFIHPPSSYLFATRICTVQKWWPFFPFSFFLIQFLSNPQPCLFVRVFVPFVGKRKCCACVCLQQRAICSFQIIFVFFRILAIAAGKSHEKCTHTRNDNRKIRIRKKARTHNFATVNSLLSVFAAHWRTRTLTHSLGGINVIVLFSVSNRMDATPITSTHEWCRVIMITALHARNYIREDACSPSIWP